MVLHASMRTTHTACSVPTALVPHALLGIILKVMGGLPVLSPGTNTGGLPMLGQSSHPGGSSKGAPCAGQKQRCMLTLAYMHHHAMSIQVMHERGWGLHVNEATPHNMHVSS